MSRPKDKLGRNPGTCGVCGQLTKRSHLRSVQGAFSNDTGPLMACKKCRKMSDEEHRVEFEREARCQ